MTISVQDSGHLQSFGLIGGASLTTGTRLTANFTDPAKAFFCQAIAFQATSSQTAVIYVCNTPTPTLTDGVQDGVLAEIPPPGSSPTTRPTFTLGNPPFPHGLNAAEIYILPTSASEKLRCFGVM